MKTTPLHPGPLATVCVFCGAHPGQDPAFLEAARGFGRLLAATGRRLVYGGGRVGMMGALADAALEAGGEVVGVIPRAMVDREWAHPGATSMRVVGTMEELFEAWTWAQLGVHGKPVGLLDAGGFFHPLLALADHMVQAGFLLPGVRDLLVVDTDPGRLLARMAAMAAAESP